MFKSKFIKEKLCLEIIFAKKCVCCKSLPPKRKMSEFEIILDGKWFLDLQPRKLCISFENGSGLKSFYQNELKCQQLTEISTAGISTNTTT